MGKLVHFSFYTVSQSIVIRQAPKFPVVGKNDFRIAECREFCLVATIYVFVASVALFCTEFLEFSWWNLDLKPFGHGFSRGMSPMVEYFNHTSTRIGLEPISHTDHSVFTVPDMRLFFCYVQLERLLDKPLDLLLDAFCICLRANDANHIVVGVAAIGEPLVSFVERVTTRQASSLALDLLNLSLDGLKSFFAVLLPLQPIPFL